MVDHKRGIRGEIIKVTHEVSDGRPRVVVEVDEDCFCSGYYLWWGDESKVRSNTWIALRHKGQEKKARVTNVLGSKPTGVQIEVV